MPARRLLLGVLLALAAVLAGPPADAHFDLDANHRTFLIVPGDDGLTLYLRVPAALAFARELATRKDPASPVSGPFIVNGRQDDGTRVPYLDTAAVRADPDRLARFVADGFRFTAEGTALSPRTGAVRVQFQTLAPMFRTPEEARAVLAAEPGDYGGLLYLGDAMIDLELTVPGYSGVGGLTVASRLPAGAIPAEVPIDNHLIDFRGGGVRVTNAAGPLTDPVTVDASALRAASTFVSQGIVHILEGLDHVLFVLCLTIGAATIGRLLWQVTGFTIGHSVTLIAGFLGLAPADPWFIPAVELAIAASIVYAGIVAVFGRGGRWTAAVIAGLGLLHGFGFSFVLGDILGPGAPHLVLSLLAFNVGVEIGQLAIVSAAFGALALIAFWNSRLAGSVRWGIAGTAVAMACFWIVERGALVAEAVRAG